MNETTWTHTANQEGRFNELMRASYRKVYNMAYRLSGNRADAEDLTQEAYYRAFRSFDDYQGDKPFENWIFRIVSRLFLDLLRSRRRRIQAVSYDAPLPGAATDDSLYFDVPDTGPTPETQFVEGQLSEELQMVLDSLKPEQRLLITLADVEQMPYAEIAELMDKPIGTIRSRLHRTHKIMRDRLERLRRSKKEVPGGAKLHPCPTL
jgi:RNA polymerase sigma-70 factor, ECF subfamily